MQTPMRPLCLLPRPPQSHLNYYLPSPFIPRECSWSTCQLTTRDQLQQTGVSVSGKLPGAGFVRDQGNGCGAGVIRYACGEGLRKCGVSQPSRSLAHSLSQTDIQTERRLFCHWLNLPQKKLSVSSSIILIKPRQIFTIIYELLTKINVLIGNALLASVFSN